LNEETLIPAPIQNPKSKIQNRIALIVPGFQSDADDWCIPALTNLVRVLAARPGVDLHVYTLRYPHRRDTYRLHGATIHAFGGAPFGRRRVWGASLGRLWAEFLAAIRREHQRAPFGVIHGFWATESGLLAAGAGRALGVPTLVHLAGGELTHDRAARYGNRAPGLARLLVALSLRLAGRITVPSGPLHAQLRRHYPQHTHKAVSWAFGVDVEMFTPANTQHATRDTLRLINAASLVPVKNQALLLAALAQARRESPSCAITLTLAGQGPLEGALRDQAARLGLANVVRFAGEVRHEALPALYQAHDAFALTSRHEAQCMAVLEAAACGLPWISTPVGVPAGLARQTPPSGWLVPPNDPGALAAALRAAADPDARQGRGAAARDAIAQSYALETQTTRLLALYARLGR
jgi:glycosyltransferase involved in cell wall biosynthesis